jgi:hypothetical protein
VSDDYRRTAFENLVEGAGMLPTTALASAEPPPDNVAQGFGGRAEREDVMSQWRGDVVLVVETDPKLFGATHRLRYLGDGTEELLRIDGDAVLERL